ncbi:transposase [Streptomyces platensis]|uniref:transposase n=1 Tax=Streptomyces platensis TaxID=58346 RepID=UPI0033E89476
MVGSGQEVFWWVLPGYSDEFNRDAVELAESSGRSVNSVAWELGINTESLRQWVHKFRAAGQGGDPVTPSEREELKRLRKQVRELEKEKLHKAAQYFAKEMDR